MDHKAINERVRAFLPLLEEMLEDRRSAATGDYYNGDPGEYENAAGGLTVRQIFADIIEGGLSAPDWRPQRPDTSPAGWTWDEAAACLRWREATDAPCSFLYESAPGVWTFIDPRGHVTGSYRDRQKVFALVESFSGALAIGVTLTPSEPR